MIVLGVFVALIPDCVELWQAYISQYLWAMAGGVWDAGNSVWTIEMWGKDASVFLQLGQMTFGIGMTLSPVLVKPYLYGDLNKTESNPATTEGTLLATTYGTTHNTASNFIDEDINYSV